MRAEVLSLRTRQFVEAARAAGQRPLAILFVQILPNALSAVIVVSSVMVASAILIESGLSFLGLGDPSVMTWGYMIGAARPFLRDAWTLSAFPGLFIVFTVLAINMVGDGLTSALDPRQARKGTRA
jgi:peptide/nickel transport system permease protein